MRICNPSPVSAIEIVKFRVRRLIGNMRSLAKRQPRLIGAGPAKLADYDRLYNIIIASKSSL